MAIPEIPPYSVHYREPQVPLEFSGRVEGAIVAQCEVELGCRGKWSGSSRKIETPFGLEGARVRKECVTFLYRFVLSNFRTALFRQTHRAGVPPRSRS